MHATWRLGAPAAALVGAALLVSCTAPPTGPTTTALPAPTEPPPPAVPRPFGLDCAPHQGIRLCRGGIVDGQDRRVPSFDGVPLDADVALPATGTGPFPLVVMLHGLGGNKTFDELPSSFGALDGLTLAARGFAVLMYTARGFGTSCGTAASRADTPACAQGWVRLADQRYEVRDTQYLAGLLVDEGLVRPDIGVVGISYGGGQALELAMLKNRMRLPDGKLVAFTSPGRHVPMRVSAVYAIWPWDDAVSALVPNGAPISTGNLPAEADRSPIGVVKLSWATMLYGVTADYYLAPPGEAPTSTLTGWEQAILKGEPYGGNGLTARALRALQTFKSAIGIPMPHGGPAAAVIQSGWTDTLFPVSEALHYAGRLQAAHVRTPLLMMFDDVGHSWAQNKQADIAVTRARALTFLEDVLERHTAPPVGVVAIPTTCPASAPSGPPVTGKSLSALQHGSLSISGKRTRRVTSTGGSPATAVALDAAEGGTLCNALPPSTSDGTAVYSRSVGPSGAHLLGAVTVRAQLKVVGRYPELVSRLWDVAPDGTRQIVALGVFRPAVRQGTATFQLEPADWAFAPGHRVELQLVGSTAPFYRRSNGTFTVEVSDLRATLPTG